MAEVTMFHAFINVLSFLFELGTTCNRTFCVIMDRVPCVIELKA